MADVDLFDFDNPEFENPETPIVPALVDDWSGELIEHDPVVAHLSSLSSPSSSTSPSNEVEDEDYQDLDQDLELPEPAEPEMFSHPAKLPGVSNTADHEDYTKESDLAEEMPIIEPFERKSNPEVLPKQAGTPDGHDSILLSHLLSYGKSGRTEFKWKLFLSEAAKGRLALAGEFPTGSKLIIPVDYDANHSNARRYMARKGWLVSEHYVMFRHLMPSGDSYIGIAFLIPPGENGETKETNESSL